MAVVIRDEERFGQRKNMHKRSLEGGWTLHFPLLCRAVYIVIDRGSGGWWRQMCHLYLVPLYLMTATTTLSAHELRGRKCSSQGKEE